MNESAARSATWFEIALAIGLVSAAALASAACGKHAARENTSSGVLAALDHHSPAADPSPGRETAEIPDQAAGPKRQALPDKPPLDVAAPPADAEVSDLGVYYKVLSPRARDQRPTSRDIALVQYASWRTSGEFVYATGEQGEPQPMPLELAAPGWRELLLDMGVGERRMVWMPSHLATGYAVGGQEILVLVVDLLGIEPAPEAPEHRHAPPSEATVTASGLAYQVLEPGTGSETPALWDKVGLRYHLWSEDGAMLRTTSARREPEVMKLHNAPKVWAEAVQTLVLGQKSRFWIPEAARQPLAADDPGGMQVAEIELVSLDKQPPPPDVPEDVARPPDHAQKTEKGVFYVVLTEGTGTVHPTADSQVKVHYTGWTTDGTMFDSSVVRGKPTIFPLHAVIEGWTDVLQVMVEGQKIRAWIPEKLAYDGKPNRPQGMLVFDIELLAIVGESAQ